MKDQLECARKEIAEEHVWDDVREQRVLVAALRRIRTANLTKTSRITPDLWSRIVLSGALLAALGLMVFGALTVRPAVVAPLATVPAQAAPPREELSLADGSHVVSRKGARIQVAEASSELIHIRQLSGEARYDVTHLPSRRFVVDAADVAVTVHGTQFTVTLDDASVSVQVHEGLVDVEHGQTHTRLAAGEFRTFPAWRARVSDTDALDSKDDAQDAGTELPGVSAGAAARTRDRAPEASLDALFAEANQARARGDFDGASARLHALLERRPSKSREALALFVLGRVEHARGNAVASAEAFTTCARITPNEDLKEDALAEAADAWSKAGAEARAVGLARDYLAHYPLGAHAARMRILAP